MTTPELMYFNGPGRGNLTRLCFVAGGVEFKDTRLNFGGEEWKNIKSDPKSPQAQLFGHMPCIKSGDLLIGQSVACACYAADLGVWSRHGSGVQAANGRAIDIMVANTNEDLRSIMYKCLFGNDESKAAGKEALPGKAAKLLASLERILERKICDGPFFVSTDGPTLADLAVFDNVISPFPGLKMLGVDLTPYPKLMACVNAVGEDEKVKKFVENGFK